MDTLLKASKAVWSKFRFLNLQLGWIAGGLTVIMMIAIMYEVVMRYFFNSPTDWYLELSCYLVVALVYLGGAFTELVDGHIRVNLIYVHFGRRLKNIADIVIHIMGLCWGSVLVWQGWKLAWHSLITGARSSEITAWPLFPSQVLVPIGAFLLCLVLVGKLVQDIERVFQGGNN